MEKQNYLRPSIKVLEMGQYLLDNAVPMAEASLSSTPPKVFDKEAVGEAGSKQNTNVWSDEE